MLLTHVFDDFGCEILHDCSNGTIFPLDSGGRIRVAFRTTSARRNFASSYRQRSLVSAENLLFAPGTENWLQGAQGIEKTIAKNCVGAESS